MRNFTQDHATNIAKKLGMQLEPGRKHTRAIFHHEGKEIVSYGIRRASKEVPHNYIPKQLHMTPRDCMQLHDCTKTVDDFVGSLRSKGFLPNE